MAQMHDDEVFTDADLVRRLLESQHPHWADLPIERVSSAGTDNAMYRLGDELAVRMPRIHWAVEMVDKEQTWLPVLAPQLPLAVPVPVAAGRPDAEYPHPWGVVRWLPGELAAASGFDDEPQAARDLAEFVLALQAVDPAGAPSVGRGLPIRSADEDVRRAVDGLRGEVDGDALLAAWDRVLDAPDYDGPPRWFHGDLVGLNLLTRNGALSAVIDWGTAGVGDPAIELVVAWNLFSEPARRAYREALDVDDAMWERGRGWALRGVVAVPYYRDTNPALVAHATRGIEAVLADS